MSPSFGLPHQSPSALHRVPAGRVPRLRRYYQGATTPCRSSRRASLPSLGGTILCTLASLLSAWRATPRAWGFCSTLRLPHPDSGGNDRASHVPGEPSCAYALLFDPGGTDAPGHRDAPTRPPCEPRRRLPRAICLSGLNHTASALAVYASQPRLPGHHARLASGCRPALPGGIRYPQGSCERFQIATHPWQSPSFPKLSWRKVRDRFGGHE